MNIKHFGIATAVIIAGTIAACAKAQQVLLSNNFNQANGNFDNGPSSEYGGTLAGSVVMESQKAEQLITNDQLNMQGSPGNLTGEIRFDNTGSTSASPPGLFDFSQGATGAALLAAGGMQISFLAGPRLTLLLMTGLPSTTASQITTTTTRSSTEEPAAGCCSETMEQSASTNWALPRWQPEPPPAARSCLPITMW